MEHSILIIEDEEDLAKIMAAYLKVEGFHVEIATDGEQGLRAFTQYQPAVVLLDIMLPKINGITLCREIRSKSDASIIMISAKNGEMDKVIALGTGADDYVTKPFSPIEVVARVKAQIRRYEKLYSSTLENPKKMTEIKVGRLLLNQSSYTAFVDEQELTLTTKEFELLYYLALNQNQVVSKDQIYTSVWGYSNYVDDNSVTVYINRLREKMDPYQLDYIKTIWGVGYKFSSSSKQELPQ